MVQSTAMKVTYYLNENEYNDYIGKNYSYSNHYEVNEELKTIRTRSTLLIVACILISALFSGGFLLFLSRRTKREAVKYHYNGYKASFVKKIHIIDYLLLYIIPICLFGVCITIMSVAIHIVYTYILAIALIGFVMVAIMYLKETKAYGKAH